MKIDVTEKLGIRHSGMFLTGKAGFLKLVETYCNLILRESCCFRGFFIFKKSKTFQSPEVLNGKNYMIYTNIYLTNLEIKNQTWGITHLGGYSGQQCMKYLLLNTIFNSTV